MDKNELHIKKPGFTTPKNYFDTLESQLIDSMAFEATAPKKNPFKTPENYFEELALRNNKKTSLKKSPNKIISLVRTRPLQYVAGIAAILLVFVSIFKFQQTNNTETNTISQIENYIENGFLEVSSLDLEVLFTDEMLEEPYIISTLEQEELFDYLSYEVDETHLTNQ